MMVDSLNIRAIYIHGLADCAASLGLMLAGLLVMWTGDNYWDGVVAIIIAVVIIFNTLWVLVPAIKLLCRGADGTTKQEINK